MSGSKPMGPWWAVLLLVFLLGSTSGCGYPKVSGRAYEMTMALEAAFADREVDALVSARAMLDKFRSAEEISASEHAELSEMIGIAEGGDWERAAKSARQLLEAQVEWQ